MRNKINSLANLIKINLKIFISIFIQNKKIIFFFNPNKKLTNITNYYIKDWLGSLKNFNVIYGYVPNYEQENVYKIYPSLCKYIYGVDVFISTYVCDYFSNKSKRVYIHHDIYDTPLTKKSNYKTLIKKFQNYDLILTPSKISSKMFEKLFKLNKKKPNIISIGYLKLDYLLRQKKKFTIKKDSIIIAPTDFNAFKKYSIIQQLPELISYIIEKLNFNVIFRPHPSNRDDSNILNIKNKFIKNKKFEFDTSENYLKNYRKSFCMITDISGTAYTYAFLNECPVLFFSNKLIEKNYKNSNYIQDRNKIGLIYRNNEEVLKIIKLIDKKKPEIKKSIVKLRENLSNFGNVKNQISKIIYKLVLKNEISV